MAKNKDEALVIELKKQAENILKDAKTKGVKNKFLFITTFLRYKTQLEILFELERAIKSESVLVEKEYVKGRKNLYNNPAISEFNRTTDSANKTVNCLLGLINKDSTLDKSEETDPLLEALAIK